MKWLFNHTYSPVVLGVLLAVAFALVPEASFAQLDQLQEVQDITGLGGASPATIAARLIRTALGFLGILAVVVVLYGGFTWMTAAGSEEKVTRAKQILIGGVIGLTIIMTSFAITTFVLNSILGATGGTINDGSGGSGNDGGLGGGSGAGVASFIVTSIVPDGAVPIRNVAVQATLNRRIDTETAENAVTIVRAGTNEAVSGQISISNNRITFVPDAACPEPNEDRKCFDANTQYTVQVKNSLKDTRGRTIDCTQDRCIGTFETGSLVDTEDPVATYDFPAPNTVVVPDFDIVTRASATDDAGVSLIEFSAGGIVYDAVPATGDLRSVILETLWNNAEFEENTRYTLDAKAIDVAGNEDTASVSVRIGPAHCYNGQIDADANETGIDCGGVCGACGGSACTENAECGSGSCVSGVCEGTGGGGGNGGGSGSGGSGGDQATRMPTIYEIEPGVGAIGQIITISGSSFGSSTGTVEFINPTTGDKAIGSLAFPRACGSDFWDPNEIQIIVPQAYTNQQAIETTTHRVHIVRQDGKRSEAADFVVRTGAPDPGICALSKTRADIGERLDVIGVGFGSTAGEVTYHNAITVTPTSWTGTLLQTVVPQGAQTGPITVTSSADKVSNPITLEIGAADESTDAVFTGSAYAWSFSTGRLLVKPQLVVACTEDRISSVPNKDFSNDVCVNARVYAEFTTLIDQTSLVYGQTVKVEECTNERCTNRALVDGDLVTSHHQGFSSISFVPGPSYNEARFKPEARYVVTVTEGIRSQDGGVSETDTSFEFTTGTNTEDCAVEAVRVAPRTESLTEHLAETEFLALATAQECQVLNGAGLAWGWTVDEGIAGVDPGSCFEHAGNDCAVVTALAEGETRVTAEETASELSSYADLSINFVDPYVVATYPAASCQEACVNIAVGAAFNISMDEGIQESGKVLLQECRNELCGHFVGLPLAQTATCIHGEDNESCLEVAFNLTMPLKTDTYYRATVSGAVTSESGVALSRLNYGEDYSWTFKTKAENAQCELTRVDVRPSLARLTEIGERQPYSVLTYGEADACSVAGQRLNPANYSWEWQTPIVNESGVAKWVTSGGTDGLITANAGAVHPGCTTSCLPAGSAPFAAVCGDGVISVGEECEDGATENGDGCSAQCLREGGDVVGQCGNGEAERLSSGAGEDCDDGNLLDGDGCSSLCLNEGRTQVFGVCADARVDFVPALGGEDCDDGNSVNGDGCSSLCVNEGSGTVLDSNAVCGNRAIESPYESCDDGNTVNGDGCSARCLQEGRGGIVSVCGNGFVEADPITKAGEACDDSNVVSGDGCSSTCKLEGSSLSYSTPSMCGDGLFDARSEYPGCEAESGSGTVAPNQLAQVQEGASALVNAQTEKVSATIRVREMAFNLSQSAELQLSCSARNDNDCGDPTRYGLADNACCSLRPTVQLTPVNGEEQVCRNAAMVGVFSEEMDTASLNKNVFLELILPEGTACPAGHVVLDESGVSGEARGILRTVGRLFSGVFGGSARAAVNGSCVMPITSIVQAPLENGSFRVSFVYRGALEPNANYELLVRGKFGVDGDLGAKSETGVLIGTDAASRFSTAADICGVDEVKVSDTSEQTPGYFFQSGETHPFEAYAYARRFAQLKEVQQVPGVYEWQWRDWVEDSERTIVSVDHENQSSSAEVSSTVNSGTAHVAGSIEITRDTLGIHGNPETPVQVAGARRVVATICDNPWPSYGAAGAYPFMDTPESTLVGVQGTGGSADENWMYFSTFYCRDSGNKSTQTDDLPALSIVAPSRAANDVDTNGVLKEYLLRVNDSQFSGDAIGIRVMENPGYLSPMAWYSAQGFTGSPTEFEVDGFEAVQDGRTVYVSAPNAANPVQTFTNIYVISYNEGATEVTREIFGQLLENFSFLVNKSDAGFCAVNGTLSADICSSDTDCSVGYCSNVKSQIQRDARRLTDAVQIRGRINAAGQSNPTLEAGSAIRGLSSSAWASWGGALSQAVGPLPTDPLNRYNNCDSGALLGYSSETCINETTGRYVCPAGSSVYHYKALGGLDYQIHVELESGATRWAQPLNASGQRGTIIASGSESSMSGFTMQSAICGEITVVHGASTSCGDGVIGPAEVCEIGQRGGGESCSLAGGDSGFKSQICNASCTAFVTDPNAQCAAASCGNGFVDQGEQCDDGENNGEYGYCGNTCSYTSGLFCGDGSLTPGAGEVCDCSQNATTLSPGGRTFGGNVCQSSSNYNGSYQANPANSCAWDCSGPASYCGDGTVDAGEQCDGTIETWAGKLCSFNFWAGKPCTVDADCGGATCGMIYGACPVSTICTSGDPDKLGEVCSVDADCSTLGQADGNCSENAVQTTRTRTCNYSSADKPFCTWNQDTYLGVECRGPITCGNGFLDQGEQCDDGNDANTDGCTNECKVNVCGDGYLNPGVEACDAGSQNGQACTSSYGASCTACSAQCTRVSTTGAYCGDGITNGSEFCDGGVTPYYYVNDLAEKLESATATCLPSQVGQNFNNGGEQYTCRQLGMCNGGGRNGEYCMAGQEYEWTCRDQGGVCVYGQCAQNCASACPITTSPQLLRMSTNTSSVRRTTIELTDYATAANATVITQATSGSIIVPACTVAQTPVVDVDYAFDRDLTRVVFVTDLSNIMTYDFDGDRPSQISYSDPSRLTVLKSVLRDTMSDMIRELSGDVEISLVSFESSTLTVSGANGTGYYANFYDVAQGECFDEGDPSADAQSRWCKYSDEQDLRTIIDEYTTGGVTRNTSEGLLAAHALLREAGDARKVIVLLTAGAPRSTSNPDNTMPMSSTTIHQSIKNEGIEIYTVALGRSGASDREFRADMIRWSSGDISLWDTSFSRNTPRFDWNRANEVYGGVNQDNGFDYAYASESPTGLQDMYEDVVDSITRIGLNFVVGTALKANSVPEGTNIQLNWPEGFRCLPDREQQLPIRVSFDGTGVVRISNVRFNMCLP